MPNGDVLDRLSRDPSAMSERSADGGIATRPARSMLPTWLLADDARDELGVGVFVGRPGGLVRVRPRAPVESPRTSSPPSSGCANLGVTCAPWSDMAGLAIDGGASNDEGALAEPGCLLLEGDLDLEPERPQEASRYTALEGWASGSS